MGSEKISCIGKHLRGFERITEVECPIWTFPTNRSSLEEDVIDRFKVGEEHSGVMMTLLFP